MDALINGMQTSIGSESGLTCATQGMNSSRLNQERVGSWSLVIVFTGWLLSQWCVLWTQLSLELYKWTWIWIANFFRVNFSWIPLDCEKCEIRPLRKIPATQYFKSLLLLTNSHDRNDITLLYFPHSVLGGGCGTLQQVGRGCASYHDNWGTLPCAPEQRACAKEKKGELSWRLS